MFFFCFLSRIFVCFIFVECLCKYDENSAAPREGAYIHGLFMEGARWDTQSGIIVESRLKELFPSMPVINVRVNSNAAYIIQTLHDCTHLLITAIWLTTSSLCWEQAITQDKQDLRNMYQCPVYKTRTRGPTYVWTFNLKSKDKPSKWTLAGVALLLQV